MGRLSTSFTSRRVKPLPEPDPEADGPDRAALTLAELPRGRRARVVGVREDTDPAVARRLFDLGFAPGAEVSMVHRAPLADPVVFRVAGYEIALRRAQARSIRVVVGP